MKFWVKKQDGFIEGNAVDFSSIFLFPSPSVFGARVTEPKNGGLWKRGEKRKDFIFDQIKHLCEHLESGL